VSDTDTTALPPYRVCDLCGGVDRDPRHTFAGVIEDVHPVNESARAALDENLQRVVSDGDLTFTEALELGGAFNDTTSTDRHIDCCASAGCPLKGTDQDAAACDHRVAVADGATGEGMRQAALSLNEEN
jgi:hypothetical protein